MPTCTTSIDRTYYTISDAATYVGASRDTIRRLIASQELPAKRVRRLWFVPKSDLDRLFGGR